jgi:hypothetical protein
MLRRNVFLACSDLIETKAKLQNCRLWAGCGNWIPLKEAVSVFYMEKNKLHGWQAWQSMTVTVLCPPPTFLLLSSMTTFLIFSSILWDHMSGEVTRATFRLWLLAAICHTLSHPPSWKSMTPRWWNFKKKASRSKSQYLKKVKKQNIVFIYWSFRPYLLHKAALIPLIDEGIEVLLVCQKQCSNRETQA